MITFALSKINNNNLKIRAMKRFEDYEKAYNKCYELLQKLTALIKETDGNLTIEIRFTYIDKYPMLSVEITNVPSFCGRNEYR